MTLMDDLLTEEKAGLLRVMTDLARSGFVKGDVADVGAWDAPYRDVCKEAATADKVTTWTTLDRPGTPHEHDIDIRDIDWWAATMETPENLDLHRRFHTVIATQVAEYVCISSLVGLMAWLARPGAYLILTLPWAWPYREECERWRHTPAEVHRTFEKFGVTTTRIEGRPGVAAALIRSRAFLAHDTARELDNLIPLGWTIVGKRGVAA